MDETFNAPSMDEMYNQVIQSGSLSEEYMTNQMYQSMDPMIQELMPIISGFVIFFNLFMLVSFILKAWGIYNINKKLGEPYPWLACIPFIQLYSFVKAGGKNGLWVLWMILGFMFFIIPGFIIYIIIAHGISKRTGRGVWSTLGILFFDFIMLPVIGYKLKETATQNSEINANSKIEGVEL